MKQSFFQALAGMVILIFAFVSQLAAQDFTTTIQADAGCTVTVATNDLGDPAIAWDATAHAAARLYRSWKYDNELHQMLQAYNLGSNRAERIALAAGLFAICGDTVLDVLVCSPNVGYQGFRTVDGVYGYLKLVKLPSGDTSKTVVYLHPGRTWLAPLVDGEKLTLRGWEPFNSKPDSKDWLSPAEAGKIHLSCDQSTKGGNSDAGTEPCPEPFNGGGVTVVHDTVYRDTGSVREIVKEIPAGSTARLGGGYGTYVDLFVTSSQGDTAQFQGWGVAGDSLRVHDHFVITCCGEDDVNKADIDSVMSFPEPIQRFLLQAGGGYYFRNGQTTNQGFGAGVNISYFVHRNFAVTGAVDIAMIEQNATNDYPFDWSRLRRLRDPVTGLPLTYWRGEERTIATTQLGIRYYFGKGQIRGYFGVKGGFEFTLANQENSNIELKSPTDTYQGPERRVGMLGAEVGVQAKWGSIGISGSATEGNDAFKYVLENPDGGWRHAPDRLVAVDFRVNLSELRLPPPKKKVVSKKRLQEKKK